VKTVARSVLGQVLTLPMALLPSPAGPVSS
jgi:hypothetical protein